MIWNENVPFWLQITNSHPTLKKILFFKALEMFIWVSVLKQIDQLIRFTWMIHISQSFLYCKVKTMETSYITSCLYCTS